MSSSANTQNPVPVAGLKWRFLAASILALLVGAAPALAQAGDKQLSAQERARTITAAREIMNAQTYCALITMDESGRPQVRTMSPLPPEEDLTVWFATNSRSRKVQEIRRNPRVTLYYADHSRAVGYIALEGRAILVEDMAEIQKRKRAYWDHAFPGLKHLVLVKIVPERLDGLSYKAGTVIDPITWRTPSLELGSSTGRP